MKRIHFAGSFTVHLKTGRTLPFTTGIITRFPGKLKPFFALYPVLEKTARFLKLCLQNIVVSAKITCVAGLYAVCRRSIIGQEEVQRWLNVQSVKKALISETM